MADPAALAQRQLRALQQVQEVLERHASDEQLSQLRKYQSPPSFGRNTSTWYSHQTYVSEALAVLAQLLDQALEAQKPKPRGRPKKQAS